jgi:hypothetical protein
VSASLERLKVLEAKQSERDEADRKRDEAEALKRGEYEKLLAASADREARAQEKSRESEERAKRTTRDRELAIALSAHNLRPGAAKQLTKLLSDELEVVPDSDGGYQVRSKDRRTVTDFIDETLKSPEYDSFVAAVARSGVAAGGATKASPTAEAQAAPPKNLGEAIMNVFKEVRSNPDNSISAPRGFKAIR